MKLTYLGTAAAEGFPAVFCNCEYCQSARKTLGKNVRTRSQALINEDFLIDLPADTYHHFLTNGIEGDKIKHVFVTHGHQDHFYPNELAMHDSCYAHALRQDELTVYSGNTVKEKFDSCPAISQNVSFSLIKAFESVTVDGYTVTSLPARHMTGSDAMFYIIESEGKTLLYAHDTGYFFEEVFDFIKEKGFVFDLISYDCTNCELPISDQGTHMGFENISRVKARLEAMGATTADTKHIVNHFSHNGNPDHQRMLEVGKKYGVDVSYDGMTVEI